MLQISYQHSTYKKHYTMLALPKDKEDDLDLTAYKPPALHLHICTAQQLLLVV